MVLWEPLYRTPRSIQQHRNCAWLLLKNSIAPEMLEEKLIALKHNIITQNVATQYYYIYLKWY